MLLRVSGKSGDIQRERERGEEKGMERENSIFDLVSTYFVISCVDRDESIVRT